MTLAVVDAGGACLGTLDVRGDFCPEGCPPGPSGAYVVNVVVAPAHRGRGLATQLVGAAKEYAAAALLAGRVYAHVDAVNDVASQLYARCGFQPVSEEGGLAAGSAVGRRVLLRCDLPPPP